MSSRLDESRLDSDGIRGTTQPSLARAEMRLSMPRLETGPAAWNSLCDSQVAACMPTRMRGNFSSRKARRGVPRRDFDPVRLAGDGIRAANDGERTHARPCEAGLVAVRRRCATVNDTFADTARENLGESHDWRLLLKISPAMARLRHSASVRLLRLTFTRILLTFLRNKRRET